MYQKKFYIGENEKFIPSDEIDLTNIKQILLQAFNKVDVYIDEIRLVPFDFKYKKVPAQLTIQDTIFPINILDVNKEVIFGIDERYCSNFKINPEKKSINISIGKLNLI